jgi:hypothetical protein
MRAAQVRGIVRDTELSMIFYLKKIPIDNRGKQSLGTKDDGCLRTCCDVLAENSPLCAFSRLHLDFCMSLSTIALLYYTLANDSEKGPSRFRDILE